MAKDPACLFYIDKWFLATKEMKADCRGWFLNLILLQYDKGSLPSDMEELANFADVRVSEYEKFQQVFEQVLKHKFEEVEINGEIRLQNPFARDILMNRSQFLDKRSNAGKFSYITKFIYKYITKKKNEIEFIKSNINISELDLKNEQVLKQVLKQTLELLISVDVSVNKGLSINGEKDALIPPKTIDLSKEHLFIHDPLFDKVKFAETFNDWSKPKLAYYYNAAETWSAENKKRINWKATIKGWASRDEAEGKFKFNDAHNTDTSSFKILPAELLGKVNNY